MIHDKKIADSLIRQLGQEVISKRKKLSERDLYTIQSKIEQRIHFRLPKDNIKARLEDFGLM